MAKKSNVRDFYKGSYERIDVPFVNRNDCFYCGELATELDHVPPCSRVGDYMALYDRHQPLLVPSCAECNRILSNSLQGDIFERFEECKSKLTSRLSKFIRYGNIWTEEDLEYAQFSGELSKFADGVQNMAVIAKRRLDWTHWPVSVNGDFVDRIYEANPLVVNGKKFKDVNDVIKYGTKVDKIPRKYFEKVLDVVGLKKIEYAYNFCRACPVKTEKQMNEMLSELVDS